MIRKFAVTGPLLLLLLLASRGLAQSDSAAQSAGQQPASQQPAPQASPNQQPSSAQEPTEEEGSLRRKRPRDHKNWNFNVGAGANTDSGTTHAFVRGGGFVGSLGAARNANKYLGLRADLTFADLPLRDSALQTAQATGDTSYVLSFTLNPIINIPVSKEWGGYVLFGPAYYHRAGSLGGDTTVPGSPCSPFWKWWGNCTSAATPLNGDFINTSQNQFGYDFGAGITRKTPSGVEIYAEYRFAHGSGNGITTDYRPITIGFRW